MNPPVGCADSLVEPVLEPAKAGNGVSAIGREDIVRAKEARDRPQDLNRERRQGDSVCALVLCPSRRDRPNTALEIQLRPLQTCHLTPTLACENDKLDELGEWKTFGDGSMPASREFLV